MFRLLIITIAVVAGLTVPPTKSSGPCFFNVETGEVICYDTPPDIPPVIPPRR